MTEEKRQMRDLEDRIGRLSPAKRALLEKQLAAKKAEAAEHAALHRLFESFSAVIDPS